jgi:hypothetical protein
MKSAVVSTVMAVLLCAGCAGTGPNTEQGAVAGGVLGAVAGGVIGHNSRGGNTVGGAVVGATAGAVAGGVIGNSIDHERGTIYTPTNPPPSQAPVIDERARRGPRGRAIPPPPPTPVEAVSAPPAPNAVWVPGYWIYDGRTYTWQSGHWVIPVPARRY